MNEHQLAPGFGLGVGRDKVGMPSRQHAGVRAQRGTNQEHRQMDSHELHINQHHFEPAEGTLPSCKLGSVAAKLSPRDSCVECESAFVNKFFDPPTETPVADDVVFDRVMIKEAPRE
jgi:hypothetical protein